MRRFAYICAGVLVFTGSAVADYRDDCKDYENPDKAIRACTVLLQLQPQNAVVYAHRGSAYITKKDYDSALRDFDAAIRIDTRQPAIIYSLRGAAHQGRREYDLAIADFTESIRLDAKLTPSYRQRAEAYEAKNDYDRAIADYTKAIALRPDSADLYYSRGGAYIKKGLYDLAISDFTKQMALAPDNAAYNDRAWAYHLKGEDAKGLADAEKAIAQGAVRIARLLHCMSPEMALLGPPGVSAFPPLAGAKLT